jgi:diguanylate cyclase (GGDEF)-like protein
MGTVSNYVGVFGDISQSKIAFEKIDRLAFYDSLTDLPNRRFLLERMHRAMHKSIRTGMELAVLFIDLDDFKNINNTLGHDVGDLLLKQVAIRLTSCVRKDDCVARLGGDEFVILLEDLNLDKIEAMKQVEAISQMILSTLNQTYMLGEFQLHNSPSIGVSMIGNSEKNIEHHNLVSIIGKKAKDSERNIDYELTQVNKSTASNQHPQQQHEHQHKKERGVPSRITDWLVRDSTIFKT